MSFKTLKCCRMTFPCGDCSIESILQWLFWSIMVLSIPVILIIMYIKDIPFNDSSNDDTLFYSFLSVNIFSFGLNMLYIYPFFLFNYTLFERFEKATINWVALSTFTEVLFQLPHNFIQDYMYSIQGSATNPIEYPYFAYGLCDSRWNDYRGGRGLLWEIETNNYIEGFSGLTILLVILLEKYYWRVMDRINDVIANNSIHSMGNNGDHYKLEENGKMENLVNSEGYKPFPHSLLFILVVAFRDAMLFRQTVSYFSDQAVEDYPFSLNIDNNDKSEQYRVNAIVGLYLINMLWIVAPVLSMVWGYAELRRRWTRTVFAGVILDSKNMNMVAGVGGSSLGGKDDSQSSKNRALVESV